MVIGGYAVNQYGYHRNTQDIDIWVDLNKENEDKLKQSFIDFGFDAEFTENNIILKEKNLLRFGEPPVRLDIFTTISGIKFGDCFERMIVTDLDGIDVCFVSIDDLIKNKQTSKRLKDLDDVERLPKPPDTPT